MSTNEMISNLGLTPIKAPELNDVKYAEKLSVVFDNINSNFEKVAIHDFIKGEPGTSVVVKEEPIFELNNGEIVYSNGVPEYTTIGRHLKDALSKLWENTELGGDIIYDNKTISVWDNFINPNNTIKLIYTSKLVDGEIQADIDTPISSLYYVFLDGRFVNSKLGDIAQTPEYATQLVDKQDFSCILTYNGESFDVLSNSLPTIYYDSYIGLCWKLNGIKSGIPVQGVKGKDGVNSILHIVKCDSVANTTSASGVYKCAIDKVYMINDGFVDVTSDDINIDDYDKASVLVLTPIDDDTNGSGFYFGQAYVDVDVEDGQEKLYAEFNTETAITNGIGVNYIITAMKNISLTNKSLHNMPGLFLPISNKQLIEGKTQQPVHLLTSTTFANADDDNNIKNTDVIFTPVSDINNLDMTDNAIVVDKYMYIRINKDILLDIYAKYNIGALDEEILEQLKSYDYVLKYKLADIVNSTGGTYWGTLTNWNEINTGSRFYGRVIDFNGQNDTGLEYDNTVYFDKINKELSTDHFVSMPTDFRNKITPTEGLYRWELCPEKDNFDIIELLNKEHNDYYGFPFPFAVIYTIDAIPTLTSDIIWFDAMIPVTDPDEKYGVDIDELPVNGNGWIEDSESIYYKRCLVPGWTITNETNGLFKFLKLVSIYKNSYSTCNDATLNLNYNVNITGVDNENSTDSRRLSVHGSIDCDNINVDGELAARQIQNVYTQNTIIGDAGMQLGKMGETGNITYKFNVDGEGNVYTNSVHCAYDLEADEVIANDTLFLKNTTHELSVVDRNNPDKEILNISSQTNNIELTDISVSITRDNKTTSINNEVPVINTKNSNIVISNTVKDLCTDSVLENEVYTGNSDSNLQMTCENVKNYNMKYVNGSYFQNVETLYTFANYTSSFLYNTSGVPQNIFLVKYADDENAYPLASGRGDVFKGSGRTYQRNVILTSYEKVTNTIYPDKNKSVNTLFKGYRHDDALCSFIINRNNIKNCAFDTKSNNKITLKLNSTPFFGVIGCSAKEGTGYKKQDRQAWPILMHRTDKDIKDTTCTAVEGMYYSFLNIGLVYYEKTKGTDGKDVYTYYKVINADNSMTYFKLTFDYTIDGHKANDPDEKQWLGLYDTTGKEVSTSTDYKLRFYEYAFNLDNKKYELDKTKKIIPVNHAHDNYSQSKNLFESIQDAYTKENVIEFGFDVMVCGYNIAFSSQKRDGSLRYILGEAYISKPFAPDINLDFYTTGEDGTLIDTDASAIQNASKDNKIHIFTSGVHWNDDNSPWTYSGKRYDDDNEIEHDEVILNDPNKTLNDTKTSNITYNHIKINDTPTTNANNMCLDGNVIMHGDYIFGLGCLESNNNGGTKSNPALFYYHKDVNNPDTTLGDTNELTQEIYAGKTKVIPLNELFDMFTAWKNGDFTSGTANKSTSSTDLQPVVPTDEPEQNNDEIEVASIDE